MSADGKYVVGNAYQGAGGSNNSRATIWNTQTNTAINLGINPVSSAGPNQRTRANGVSDDGRVVGGYGGNNSPLVWIDAAGTGNYSVVNVNAVSGQFVNSVNAVSGNGQWAVGAGYTGTANGSAYRFNTSTNQLELLGKLNAVVGGVDIATATNFDGSLIVGYENDSSANPGNRVGFVWTAAGTQSLDSFLAGYGIDQGNSFNFATPIGMSSNGVTTTIVGFGYAVGSSTAQGFEVTIPFAAAVPEPTTYAMMLAGLGAIGFLARRRRDKTAA